jgi:hypothetical protein
MITENDYLRALNKFYEDSNKSAYQLPKHFLLEDSSLDKWELQESKKQALNLLEWHHWVLNEENEALREEIEVIIEKNGRNSESFWLPYKIDVQEFLKKHTRQRITEFSRIFLDSKIDKILQSKWDINVINPTDVCRENFSEILFTLLKLSSAYYMQNTSARIKREWLRDFVSLDKNEQTKFPYLKKIIDSWMLLPDRFEAHEHLVEIQDIASFSQKQSDKNLAGSIFENALSCMFLRCGFKPERQANLPEATEIPDFIFPNTEIAIQKPNECFQCECQTTLKDRFRLTSGKGNAFPLQVFGLTADGANIYSTTDTITPQKGKEWQKEKIRLVCFKHVYERKKHQVKNVWSFEKFIQYCIDHEKHWLD